MRKESSPRRIGRYRVLERLGSGVSKTVWRASERNGREVALLEFHAAGPAASVQAEVVTAIEFAQPHEFAACLPDFFELFEEEGRHFIARELLDYPLQEEAPLRDTRRWLRIARDLCRGLARIHEANRIHRDIKLENCGVALSGRVKIFDLGTVADPTSACTMLTRAPEVLCGAAPTAASDVWALGATLYALRTGDYPFADRECMAAKADLNEELASSRITEDAWRERRRELDDAIVARAMAEGAESRLAANVRQRFSPLVQTPLVEMLNADPARRRPARHYAERWSHALI